MSYLAIGFCLPEYNPMRRYAKDRYRPDYDLLPTSDDTPG